MRDKHPVKFQQHQWRTTVLDPDGERFGYTATFRVRPDYDALDAGRDKPYGEVTITYTALCQLLQSGGYYPVDSTFEEEIERYSE